MGELSELVTVCLEKGYGLRYQGCILVGRCSGNASTEGRTWSEIKNTWGKITREAGKLGLVQSVMTVSTSSLASPGI